MQDNNDKKVEVQNKNTASTNWQEAVFDSAKETISPFNNIKSRDTETVVNDIDSAAKNDEAILNQFAKNEEQNRKFKPKVFISICCFIGVQLLLMTIIILIVVIGLVVGDGSLWFIHKIDSSICQDLFSFLKYYISATIVELLAMLFFIVKRVFENNVSKMFETNQKRGKKDNEKKDSKHF